MVGKFEVGAVGEAGDTDGVGVVVEVREVGVVSTDIKLVMMISVRFMMLLI